MLLDKDFKTSPEYVRSQYVMSAVTGVIAIMAGFAAWHLDDGRVQGLLILIALAAAPLSLWELIIAIRYQRRLSRLR